MPASTMLSLTQFLLRVKLKSLPGWRTGNSLSCRVEDSEREGSGGSLTAPHTDLPSVLVLAPGLTLLFISFWCCLCLRYLGVLQCESAGFWLRRYPLGLRLCLAGSVISQCSRVFYLPKFCWYLEGGLCLSPVVFIFVCLCPLSPQSFSML